LELYFQSPPMSIATIRLFLIASKEARAAKGKKADDIRYKRYKYAFGINPKNKGKKPLPRKKMEQEEGKRATEP